MNKGCMSKALRSIELKFGYILYVYKDLNLNVIKHGHVQGFHRPAGAFSFYLGQLRKKAKLSQLSLGA